MNLSERLPEGTTVFIDTAPIIYFIEAHPRFGPIAKEFFDGMQSGKFRAFSSVITFTEVLPKPIENGDEKLAKKFADFLKYGKNLTLLEITEGISEKAGELRGRYSFLKTVDAIQISAALDIGANSFLTNLNSRHFITMKTLKH